MKGRPVALLVVGGVTVVFGLGGCAATATGPTAAAAGATRSSADVSASASSSGPVPASSTPTPATTPVDETTAPVATATVDPADVDACLFTIAQVSTALTGTWSTSRHDHVCVYHSDRGALFGTVWMTTTSATDRQKLFEAGRLSCSGAAHEVPVRSMPSYSCVERHPDGDTVTGNTISRGLVWEVIIDLTPGDPATAAKQDAVDALLRQVPVPT